jgi:hypothetical protein
MPMRMMTLAAETFRMGRAGALIALVAAGCLNRPPDIQPAAATGSVQLSLTLGGGLVITHVNYRITGPGLIPLAGTLDVHGDTAVSPVFGGLPAGGGYAIELRAGSVDGSTSCQGAAGFSVQAGVTTPVRVMFQCRAGGGIGSAQIDFSVNNCPVLTSYLASPGVVGAGGTAAVSAQASDPDRGAVLAYNWSAPDGGQFANPAAASTTFQCNGPGGRRLRITVSDGECSSSGELQVVCEQEPPPDDCEACAAANCAVEGPGCGSLADPTRRALCQDLRECMIRTNCNEGGRNNPACWCGTVDLSTCTSIAGAANGVCLQQELAAAESTSPGIIVERFADPNFASGAAHNRALCMFELCPEHCR